MADGVDDLVLLTGEGLRRLLDAAERIGIRAEVIAAIARARTITRGPKPARALHDVGLASSLPAAVPTSAGVIDELSRLDLSGRRVGVQLYGEEPNRPLVDFLEAPAPASHGRALHLRVRQRRGRGQDAGRARSATAGVDAIAFTSASQVDRLWQVATDAGLEATLRAGLARVRVAAIGPIVDGALASRGVRVDVEPEKAFVMRRLVSALAAALGPARMKAAAAAAVMVVAACTDLATGIGGRPGPEAGLLRGKQPIESAGVTHVARLTDGITAAPGDPARTDPTSLFSSPDGHVVYDLGSSVPIACVALDADSGSSYTLNVSADGVAWQPMSTVATTGEPGIQTRAGAQADRGGPLRAPGRGARRRPARGRRAVDRVGVGLHVAVAAAAGLQRGTPVESVGAEQVVAVRRARVRVRARVPPQAARLHQAARRRAAGHRPGGWRFSSPTIWPPPSSMHAPLAGGAAIVAAAVAVRVVVSRLRRRR